MTQSKQPAKVTSYVPSQRAATAARAIAEANTASFAMLKAIAERLPAAQGSSWGDAGTAIHVAEQLSHILAGLTPGFDSGDVLEIPAADEPGHLVRIAVEGY